MVTLSGHIHMSIHTSRRCSNFLHINEINMGSILKVLSVSTIVPAARDAVVTAEEAAVAEEVTSEVPVQPCLGRHQRLVPSRI